MSHVLYSEDIVSENNLSTRNYRVELSSQATANSTKTLTNTSEGFQVFTGTTAGQIVRMPDATTLDVGRYKWIANKSTQLIRVEDSTGAEIHTLTTGRTGAFILENNSTAAGSWIHSVSSNVNPTSRTITLSFPSASGQATPGFITKSTSFVPAARFFFQGSALVGTPVELFIVTRVDTATTGTFRLVDITNGNNVIAGPFQFTNTNITYYNLTTFANVPVTPAIFEVQLSSSAANKETEIDSLVMRME